MPPAVRATTTAFLAVLLFAAVANAGPPQADPELDGSSGLADADAAAAPLPSRALAPRARRLAGGPWAVMSPDRRHTLLYGLRGGVLHDPRGRTRRVVMPGRPYRVAVAPGGALIAYTSERSAAVLVIDPATRAIRWRGAFEVPYSKLNVGFLDATTAIVSTGCRILRIDLARPQPAPVAVGAALCVESTALTGGDDLVFGDRFWYRRGPDAAAPRLLDASSGQEHELPWTRDADVAVADDGSVVCAARRYARQPDVLCARPGAEAVTAIPGVPRWMALSQDGARVSALIELDDQRSELLVADPRTGSLRSLGVTTDTRVYAVGADLVTNHGPDGGATLWRPDLGYLGGFFAGAEVEYAYPTTDPSTLLVPIARGAGEVFHAVRF